MIEPATAEAIVRAGALLRAGEVVAFPTETVYGLGADALNARAVARVFAIKQRPSFDPLIVHVADAPMAARVVAEVPEAARRCMDRFWPGPLTLVLPRAGAIPDLVTAGLPTVGIRLPDHPVACALIRAAGTPLAAPSANPFGYISPTTAAHVAAHLGDAVPLILDGGPCRVGLESTIVSLADAGPVLLRHGAVSREMLEAVLGPVAVRTDAPLPTAPGQLPRHYAPRTPLTLVADPHAVPDAERRDAALLLAGAEAAPAGFRHVERLAPDGDLLTAASRLFAALRALDAGGYARIVAVPVAETGIGRAINDRLRRARAPVTSSGA